MNGPVACLPGAGVRLWQGDFCELPAYLGSADMIVFTDEPFGTAQTPRWAGQVGHAGPLCRTCS